MRRREFIAGLGSAAAWPVVSRAQQPVRRVGVLVGRTENTQDSSYLGVFRDGLSKLGWVEGSNLRTDLRFSGEDAADIRANAAALVSLAPDVIVTITGAAMRAVQQQTRTIPIVIMLSGDVLESGAVKSVAHPEGNVTGLAGFFSSLGGVWLQLLKEAAPQVERVAYIGNQPLATTYFASIEEASRSLAAKAIYMPYRGSVELSHAIDAFAAGPAGGLIFSPPSTFDSAIRETILRLSVEHRLPSIGATKSYPAEGGLISYGSDAVDLSRRTPFYVDRILRGAKVSELPVEYPTKFELVINIKTAKALGLTVPQSILVRADEVIE